MRNRETIEINDETRRFLLGNKGEVIQQSKSMTFMRYRYTFPFPRIHARIFLSTNSIASVRKHLERVVSSSKSEQIELIVPEDFLTNIGRFLGKTRRNLDNLEKETREQLSSFGAVFKSNKRFIEVNPDKKMILVRLVCWDSHCKDL